MNEEKLIRCFQAVFPDLSPEHIRTASAETLQEWDSVAMINLLNLISEEFQIETDWDRVDELTSYQAVSAMVASRA